MKNSLLLATFLSLTFVSCEQSYTLTKNKVLEESAFSGGGGGDGTDGIGNNPDHSTPSSPTNNTPSNNPNSGDKVGNNPRSSAPSFPSVSVPTAPRSSTTPSSKTPGCSITDLPIQDVSIYQAAIPNFVPTWSCSTLQQSIDCLGNTVHDMGDYGLNWSTREINAAARNKMIESNFNKERTCVKFTNTIAGVKTQFEGAWYKDTSHSCTLKQSTNPEPSVSTPPQTVSAPACSAFVSAITSCGAAYRTQREDWQSTGTISNAGITHSTTSDSLYISGFGLNKDHSGVAHFCKGHTGSGCSPTDDDFVFTLNLSSKAIRVRGSNSELMGCVGAIVSPLVVDLGRGVKLSDPMKTRTYFDIDGDGEEDRISCVQEGAFLSLPDSNGFVSDINELFGDNTIGPDGKKSANGFLALAKYDDDRDGMITANDSVFERLKLWKDADCDGKAARHELRELESAMISMIDLDYSEMMERDAYGNETRQRSVVELINGKLMKIFDVWFSIR